MDALITLGWVLVTLLGFALIMFGFIWWQLNKKADELATGVLSAIINALTKGK